VTEVKRTALVPRPTYEDRKARLGVSRSFLDRNAIRIDGFNPAETGFGDQMCVPLTEEMKVGHDLGCFLELTRDQAIDLHVKLTNVLFAQDKEGE
jgi:hypothetical protein